MGRMRLAAGATAVLVMVAAIISGCSSTPAIKYAKSDRNPVVIYSQTQALPPEFAPNGPTLIVYGTGTAYQQKDRYHYLTGTLTQAQLNSLISSIADKGFYSMSADQGKGAPGGMTDHVTVNLTGNSKSVEGPDGTGGEFGAIVSMLESYRIPGATPYAPNTITLHAAEYSGTPWTGKTVAWTADPQALLKAASMGAESVSGAEAQKIWALLGDSYSPSGDGAFSSQGKLYNPVYAATVFQLQGV